MSAFQIRSFSVLFVFGLSPLASGAFTATFPTATFAPGADVGSQIAGKDGWSIDDPLFDANDVRGLSYSNWLDSSLAAQLGGAFYVADPGATIYLSHAVSGELQYTQLTIDFAIQASNEFNPGRDVFGFSFRDSGGDNIFTFTFLPWTSATYPDNDAYKVQYTVGNDPTPDDLLDTNAFPMFIRHNGLYSLSLGFSPAGANPTFSGSITGSNAVPFSGVGTGLGSDSIASFGALWTLNGDGANNGIIFDNISIVPEPSSTLLLGVAGLGLALRRRRA